MNGTISKNPQILKFIEGKASWELWQMLVNRELDLREEEYLEGLSYALMIDELSALARQRLQEIPDSVKKTYIGRKEADERVLRYLLEEGVQNQNTAVLLTFLQNKWLPDTLLYLLGEHANESVLEAMLLNPLPLVAYPEVMEKMERNPLATDMIKQKINEIRDLFFDKPGTGAATSESDEKTAQPENSETSQELSDLIEDSGSTATTFQRISTMSVAEKIRLAFKGSKTERMILMKDPNKVVQYAVIDSPKITEDEILSFSGDRSIAGDIITKIAESREWAKNYTILLALVQNPKVPVSRATAFIKQLHERDLKMLVMDKNINPVVRQLAVNYYKTRHDKR